MSRINSGKWKDYFKICPPTLFSFLKHFLRAEMLDPWWNPVPTSFYLITWESTCFPSTYTNHKEQTSGLSKWRGFKQEICRSCTFTRDVGRRQQPKTDGLMRESMIHLCYFLREQKLVKWECHIEIFTQDSLNLYKSILAEIVLAWTVIIYCVLPASQILGQVDHKTLFFNLHGKFLRYCFHSM